MRRFTRLAAGVVAVTALATPVWAAVVTGEPSSDMVASFDGDNSVVGTGWFASFSEAAPSAYVPAKQGQGFTVSDSVRPNGNATSAVFSGDFSVAVLVKLPTYSSSTPGSIFGISNLIYQSEATGLALGQTSTGLRVDYVTKDNGNTTLLTTDAALEGWASLVVVFDRDPLDENGAAQSGQTTTTLYVNGTAVATNTQATTTPNGTWLALGNIYGGATQVSWAIHSGLVIDEVRGYSSALSATNVAMLHNLWLPPTTEASRTVSGSAGMWSTASDWSPEGVPGKNTDVTLTVSDVATLSMDAAASLSSLTANDGSADGSASLTFTGTNSLTSATTTLNVNTDVSAITANLGALTVTAGKKLTVGANTSASSWGIGGSTLATKGNFTVSDGLWNVLTASAAANRPAKLLVESGTLTLKANQETTAITYAVEVADDATLDINHTYGSAPSSVTLGNNATLCNGGDDTSPGKIQWTELVLTGDAKLSGNTFASIASSWNSQNLTLGGHTLTVEMSGGKTFYLASAGARKSAEDTSSEAGTVKVTSGTLSLYSDKNADSLKRANVVLAGGTLKVDGKGLLGSLTGTSGTLNLNGKDVSIGDLDGNDDFSGVLTGATGSVFRKVGSGTQTLSGDLSGFAGTYQVDEGTLELPVAGDLTLTATVAGSGTLKKSGAGTLTLLGSLSGTVELAAGTLDMAALRPAVTVTGAGTTLMLSQDLDEETVTPISLSFAEGIESCTVETKNLSGTTKTLTIFARNVTEEGTVNVTFPTETGTVNDSLPEAHRTCGFENSSLAGLSTSGMQSMTFTPSSLFPGQGNYGQIERDGRPYSPDNNSNGFRTETGERGFTFSLKVCPNTCTNKGILFSFGKSANAVALLWQQDNPNSTTGRFAVYSVLSSGGASEPVVTSQLVTKAAWHAVSVVSSLETKRFYIIVDGKMAKSEVLSAGLSITNGVFQVGSVYANAPSEWEWSDGIGAQVDDFRFDKVPLTQAQIARLLFHYAVVSANGELANLTEFGTGTQVAISALPASADARISVAEGVTATATLTTPVAAKLQVWGAGTLEVAKGESAQTIAAVELKEETTTLLLHRSQDEVVTSRVGTVGTFKFSGGTMGSPLVVNQTVRFPGAIAVAADSCINIYYTGSDNASYRVTGEGKNSTVILTSNHPWGVYNGDGAVTSFFRDLTLSLGGKQNLWFRAGLTDNVWLDIQSDRTIHQEADWGNSVNGVLTVRNLTGGGTFNSKKASPQALCLLNIDETASEYTGETTFSSESNASMKLVFAGKWTVPNAMTTTNTPATVEIGDGTTETDVQLKATGNVRALTVAANATLDVATGTPTTIGENTARSFSDNLTLTNNGTLKLTSGYTYINVDGTGKTVVPAGSTFVFGIGGENRAEPFKNSLTVEAAGDSKGELQLRTYKANTTLVVPTLVLNGKVTQDQRATPTLEVTGTGTLTAGSTLGAGVALTVAERATCTLAGPTIDYHATTPLTVDGELSVTKTTTAYRQVVGSGKISVAEGKTLTIGRDSDTGKTGLVAGEDGFTGTLEVASDATLALPNYYTSTAYTVENCDVTVNGMLSGGATLTLSAGKTLSGTGTINVPVSFAEVESATVSMASDTSLTFGSTLSVSKKVELAGAVTLANGAVLSGLGTLSGAVTCQNGATVEAGPTLSGSVTFADGVKLLAKLTDSSDVNNPIRYTLQCASTPTFEGTVKVSTPGYDLSVMKAPGLEIGKFSVDEASEKTDIQLRLIANEDASLTLMTFCKPVITGAPDDMTAEEKETLSERITNQFLEVMAQHNIVVSPVSASADPNKPNAKVEGVLLFEHVVKVGYVGDEETGYDPVALVSYDFGVADMTIRDLTLTGDTEATRYVVLCAKVSNGTASGDDAAAYGTKTTVSLLLGDKVCDGTEGNGPAATELTDDQLTAMNLTRGAGEKWFAVPMSTLGIGTHAFKVKAFKTTPAN